MCLRVGQRRAYKKLAARTPLRTVRDSFLSYGSPVISIPTFLLGDTFNPSHPSYATPIGPRLRGSLPLELREAKLRLPR